MPITIIKWNGNKERVAPELLKKAGRKAKEKDIEFFARKLKEMRDKKEKFSLPEDGHTIKR